METMQFDDLDNALLSLMAQLRERMVARTDLSTSMEGQIAYAVVRAIQISPDIAPNDKLAAVNYVSKVLVEIKPFEKTSGFNRGMNRKCVDFLISLSI
jgi:hypothetical protein